MNYRPLAKIIPKSLRARIHSLLTYYGIKSDQDVFIGFINFSSIMIGLIAGFLLSFITHYSFWIFFIIFTSLTHIIVYVWMTLVVDKKTRLVEEFLPDALQLITSNLKAGSTPDKALLLSARPEFGPLKDEIDLVGKKVTLGKNISMALIEMTQRVHSKKLLRAVELINSGIRSGGSLANLLETTANHLKEQALVDKKIKANITMYVIFIFVAAAIITPLLLALSSILVTIIQGLFSNVEIPSGALGSLPLNFGKVALSSTFLLSFIMVFVVTNCFMSSLLLGLIGKGKQREGVRYFIPMVLLAIPIFFIVQYLVSLLMLGVFSF